ncbi:MAG: hypothetical protein Q9166_007219 [cf. Caloplaca sp. 2 TL-2023]
MATRVTKPEASRVRDYLSDPTRFANTLFAISQTEFTSSISRSDSDAYRDADPDTVKKHIDLLDSLALILVYEAGSDVVATGLKIEDGNYTVCWAKNSQGNPSFREISYLSNLEKAFKRMALPTETLNIIIPMCKKKIISRMKKLTKALENPATPRTAFAFSTTNPFKITTHMNPQAEKVRQYLIQMGRIGKDIELDTVLNKFASDVKSLTPNSSVADVAQVIDIAYRLSLNLESTTLETIPGCDKYEFKKIRKIGSYLSTCVTVYSTLYSHPQFRPGFRIEQIQVPSTPRVEISTNTVEALNVWANYFNLPRIEDFEEMKTCYPKAQSGKYGSQTQQMHQHCELTVGLSLWKRKQDHHIPGPVEIGCSKASCYYCALYLQFLNERSERMTNYNPIILRGVHEKCIHGWSMPADSEFDDVRDRFFNKIGDVMHSIMYNVSGPHRKSDSHSTPNRRRINEALAREVEASTIPRYA